MSGRKRSKIVREAVPYDVQVVIGGKHWSGRNGPHERFKVVAKLDRVLPQGLAQLWKAIEQHAAPSVIRCLAARGCTRDTFAAAFMALYHQEQPRRGEHRWALVMMLDEQGLRVVQRKRRFMVLDGPSRAG